MSILFYVDDCLIFVPSRDKIDEVCASLQAYFKIEDDGELNKYLGIDLDRCPDGSIHLRKPYLTQRILNMIPGMDKSRANPTPVVKSPLVKNEGYQERKNDFNYRSVISSLDFLTDSTRPEAQFVVHQCARFSDDTKLPHDQAVKCILNYLKVTDTQGLIMKPDPEKGIKCYVDAGFAGGWNQEEGKDPGSVLSRTGYVITYANCPIILARRIQT